MPRKFASQGQVRSIVLGLKLAELEAARHRGENPLFLLDDLSSELDRTRTRKLVELLSERDNQIWITTTDPKHLGPLPSSSLSMWHRRWYSRFESIDSVAKDFRHSSLNGLGFPVIMQGKLVCFKP